MKKIVIGKFKPGDTFIYKINPLTKFMSIIFVMISIGIKYDPNIMIIYYILILTLTLLSKISIKDLLAIIKPFRFLLLFTFVIQLFYTTNISDGVVMSAVHTSKFLQLIVISAIFTLTTPPYDIVRIIYLILKPFRIFGVNPEEMSASALIAIRFVPVMFEEADRIFTAQNLRGIIPKNGIRLLFSLHSFMIPLFRRVFYYAEQISITLRYRNNWSTVMKMEKMKSFDYITIGFTIMVCYGITTF